MLIEILSYSLSEYFPEYFLDYPLFKISSFFHRDSVRDPVQNPVDPLRISEKSFALAAFFLLLFPYIVFRRTASCRANTGFLFVLEDNGACVAPLLETAQKRLRKKSWNNLSLRAFKRALFRKNVCSGTHDYF